MQLTDWLFFNPAPDNSPPDVVLLAVAHPVMHQVTIRAHPDGGSIPAQIKGEIISLNHGAVHHMA